MEGVASDASKRGGTDRACLPPGITCWIDGDVPMEATSAAFAVGEASSDAGFAAFDPGLA
jgi:hypothetical protein